MPWDFPGGSDGKASVYSEGDLGSIPGSGRFPGEGNGNPLQYSCLENPMIFPSFYGTSYNLGTTNNYGETKQTNNKNPNQFD